MLWDRIILCVKHHLQRERSVPCIKGTSLQTLFKRRFGHLDRFRVESAAPFEAAPLVHTHTSLLRVTFSGGCHNGEASHPAKASWAAQPTSSLCLRFNHKPPLEMQRLLEVSIPPPWAGRRGRLATPPLAHLPSPRQVSSTWGPLWHPDSADRPRSHV